MDTSVLNYEAIIERILNENFEFKEQLINQFDKIKKTIKRNIQIKRKLYGQNNNNKDILNCMTLKENAHAQLHPYVHFVQYLERRTDMYWYLKK